MGLYEDACFKILHVTLNFVKFSFKYHNFMYLLSSVLYLLFALTNEDLRFEYLVLKEFSVSPICRSGEGDDLLSRRSLGKQLIP